MVTKMVRHHDQEEREQERSYHWDTVRSVLLKAVATNRAGDFSDEKWIHLIHESSNKKRVSHCLDHKSYLCYLWAIQGYAAIKPELIEYTSIPYD